MARRWKELRDKRYDSMTPEVRAAHEERVRKELDRVGRGVIGYPVVLTPDDNGTFLVTFPDVPGAVTFGETEEEALTRAVDALLTVFDGLVREGKEMPLPSWRVEGAGVVEIPLDQLPNPGSEPL